ncbi:hypothetical protein [Paracoccus versutus]
MTPTDTAELERHADTERNRIINRCSTDLEIIVNGHDPEVHNLNVRVWDRLDRMAVEVEQHLAHRKAEAGMRALLLAGCDLLADEYDNLKSSISMPDGSLSPNDLDKWAVEKVAAMDDWIASVKATLCPTSPTEGGRDAD